MDDYLWNGNSSNPWLTESPYNVFFPPVEKVIQPNEWSAFDIFGWFGLLFKGKIHSALQIVPFIQVLYVVCRFRIPIAEVGGRSSLTIQKHILIFISE